MYKGLAEKHPTIARSIDLFGKPVHVTVFHSHKDRIQAITISGRWLGMIAKPGKGDVPDVWVRLETTVKPRGIHRENDVEILERNVLLRGDANIVEW